LKTLTRLFSAAIILSLGALDVAAETGDLKMRFQYAGDAFQPKPIDENKDVEFCGKHGLVDESLLINKENNGITNVVVYVYTGRGGSKLDEIAPANNMHELANKNCRFEPHILITQVGDKLKVTNPDPVGHNANMNFFNNKAANLMIPSGQAQEVDLEKGEPAPIPIDCNIHPWMKAYVVVLEHPFAAASDENGELTIKGLPAGEKLTFRVYHESGAINEVKIDGKEETWRRSRFEVDIKPGMNDMGTIMVPADALQ